ERKKREEEERKKREEEERKKREEEERKKREEEERKKREEEERKRREEEDRRREEEDRRREEEDRRREEEERKRREEENRGREEEERKRREEENRRREEEDRRREEEDRQRVEEEQRYASEEESESSGLDFGGFDLPSVSEEEDSSGASFELPDDGADEPESGSGFDLPSLDGNASDDFTADFDRQQELLRKREEEEERRRHEAEEARLAVERAQREEDAREEAARRAAMEAEMRTRVEQEKADRAERQRAKEEEYKRKIEEEEERKREEAENREREEFQRSEAERKRREDDLVRRRRESEEADRKRAELKRLQKSGRIRSPMERMRPFIIGVVVLIGIVLGGIQLMPMSGYIPAVEKLVSEDIGEPVTIGSMQMSVLSGFELKFGDVKIGTTEDVSLRDVVVSPELGSLFGDKVVVKSIRADGGTIVREAVERLPGWLGTSMAGDNLTVRHLGLRNVKVDMRNFDLPAMNADVNFRRDGAIVSARVIASDGSLSVNIDNGDGSTDVTISAANWTPPFGAPIVLTDFTGSGTIRGSTLNLNSWDATVYGGQTQGTAQLSWANGWQLNSRFEFARIETDRLLRAFSDTAKVTGSSSGSGNFTARSRSIDNLFDQPSLQASFTVKKGTLDGADLVRALQAGGSVTQGGSTRFENLEGDAIVSGGRYSYRDVKLSAGILSASSNFNISSNQALSGRVYVSLISPANRLSANLRISGTLKGPTLRR
ncbi:MAG: AsmA-like C-terminal region-containing protein, partial [Burkholderiales bacterium]